MLDIDEIVQDSIRESLVGVTLNNAFKAKIIAVRFVGSTGWVQLELPNLDTALEGTWGSIDNWFLRECVDNNSDFQDLVKLTKDQAVRYVDRKNLISWVQDSIDEYFTFKGETNESTVETIEEIYRDGKWDLINFVNNETGLDDPSEVIEDALDEWGRYRFQIDADPFEEFPENKPDPETLIWEYWDRERE